MDTTTFEKSARDLADKVRPQIEEAKSKLGRLNGQIASLIQDHPGACLLGALALGYVVARVARSQG